MKTDREFSVIEYASFFAIRRNLTGEERCIGDGVDMLFDCDMEPIGPGSTGFVEMLEDFFNSDVSETLEAYFQS